MKPILFNTEMVRAILDGRKTITRRIVHQKYSNTDLTMFTNKYGTRLVERQNDAPEPVEFTGEDGLKHTRRSLVAFAECKPPYQAGDVLYVRETWCNINKPECEPEYYFFADALVAEDYDPAEWKWHPSIHMPKEAARIFLRVTDVKAERLQDITPEGAVSEGIELSAGTPFPKSMAADCHGAARDLSIAQAKFVLLWDSTVKKSDLDRYGWSANPWVWVISFERCEKP